MTPTSPGSSRSSSGATCRALSDGRAVVIVNKLFLVAFALRATRWRASRSIALTGAARRARSSRSKIGVQLRRYNRTRIDWNDLVRPLPIESDGRRIVAMVHDKRHLIAVRARMRHSDGIADLNAAQAADSL